MTRTQFQKAGLVCLAGLMLSGCSLFRPAPGPDRGPDLATSFNESSGQIAVERERFAFALEESRPAAPRMPAPVPTTQVAQAGGGLPVLVIGTPGQYMNRDDHGSTRRLAQFLCAERPDWPRAGATTAGRNADWIENGRWHIVNPCPAPMPEGVELAGGDLEPSLPLSPFTAPDALIDPIMSTSSRLSWPTLY